MTTYKFFKSFVHGGPCHGCRLSNTYKLQNVSPREDCFENSEQPLKDDSTFDVLAPSNILFLKQYQKYANEEVERMREMLVSCESKKLSMKEF